MAIVNNKKRIGPWHGLRLTWVGLILLALSACASATEPACNPEQVFSTPEQAVAALVDATRQDNEQELLTILGPLADDLIRSGDPVADKMGRDKFLEAYDAAHRLENGNADKKILVIGAEDWPMPIPLVRGENGWQWDTDAGDDEILNRRIGRNELATIEVCRAYVEAQRDYAARHRRAHGQLDYAQKFVSTKGKHDGLYWQQARAKRKARLARLWPKPAPKAMLRQERIRQSTRPSTVIISRF